MLSNPFCSKLKTAIDGFAQFFILIPLTHFWTYSMYDNFTWQNSTRSYCGRSYLNKTYLITFLLYHSSSFPHYGTSDSTAML